MIRYLVLVFLFVCIAQAVDGKSCDTQSDCSEDECCFSWRKDEKEKKCHPLVKPGEICVEPVMIKEAYHHSCPCVQGYICRTRKEGFGIIKKCRKEESDEE